MDLNKLAKLCYNNAMRLGYVELDKHASEGKILTEVEELHDAGTSPQKRVIRLVLEHTDNDSFIKMFQKHCKDTEAFELIDIIFVCLTRLFKIKADVGTVMLTKLRYNRLREKK